MTTTTLTHDGDAFDGILDFLGKDKGTTTWAHPETTRGYVTTSQSTTNAGLVAANAVDQATDTTSGRSHTTNVTGSWWKIDFGSTAGVTPTYVGIKGQQDGSNHPRNFKIQGSQDDVGWEDLVDEDSTGPGNNTWYSTAVSTSNYFRYIRILQYGANSSSLGYLVIGDVEIWGTYDDAYTYTSHTPETGETTVAYSSDGLNGLIDWLGRDKGGVGFAHPESVRSHITISANSVFNSNGEENAFDHSDAIYHSNNGSTAEWVKVDFGDGNTVQPTRFGVLSRPDANSGHLRNFDIEGSNDDSDWTELASVTSDGPSNLDTWYSVACTASEGYRYIRINQTGLDSSGTGYLTGSEFELWGTYDDGTGGGGGGGDASLLWGDALQSYLAANESVTSQELVGMLNELNSTTNKGEEESRQTYLDSL